MEHAIQVFAAVSLLVIGLSHLFQPKAWVQYFQALVAQGTSGAFIEGFLCLSFGGIIVGFHNVWHWPAILLTLFGWAQVLKGLGRFVAPQFALRVMGRVSAERAWFFQLGGVFALGLSGFFWWLRFRPEPAADLLVSMHAGSVSAPDSLIAGWTRIRVQEDGTGHILVVFRLPATATRTDVAAFLAALDTARTTPPPALALGGPEIGDTGEVVIQLTAGRYVLGCVSRGRDGHRHASTGEAKEIVVTGRDTAAPPRGTQDVPMVDFAYTGPEQWKAGSHLLRVENRGRQDHQLRIVRLLAGSTLKDWINADDPGAHAKPVAGVARLGAGAVAYLPVELPRGEYVLLCLIPDAVSGRPHVALGMFRAIHVE